MKCSMLVLCPFYVRSKFDSQLMNTFMYVRCSKIDVRVHSMFDEMVFDTSLISNGYNAENMHFWPHVGKAKMCFGGLHLFLKIVNKQLKIINKQLKNEKNWIVLFAPMSKSSSAAQKNSKSFFHLNLFVFDIIVSYFWFDHRFHLSMKISNEYH